MIISGREKDNYKMNKVINNKTKQNGKIIKKHKLNLLNNSNKITSNLMPSTDSKKQNKTILKVNYISISIPSSLAKSNSRPIPRKKKYRSLTVTANKLILFLSQYFA